MVRPSKRRADHPLERHTMTKITPTLRRLREALWTAAIAAAVVLAGFAMMRPGHIPSHQPVYRGDADIRSEFTLINHDGQTVTQDDYKGRWQLVFSDSPIAPTSARPLWPIWAACLISLGLTQAKSPRCL